MPIAVSAESIAAELPSNTKLLISETSAFVRNELSTILSMISVATITGFKK